jgi:hypothetical protein
MSAERNVFTSGASIVTNLRTRRPWSAEGERDTTEMTDTHDGTTGEGTEEYTGPDGDLAAYVARLESRVADLERELESGRSGTGASPDREGSRDGEDDRHDGENGRRDGGC